MTRTSKSIKLILDSSCYLTKPNHLYDLHKRLNKPESVVEIKVLGIAKENNLDFTFAKDSCLTFLSVHLQIH
jgi:hypothetical protein